MNAQNSFFRETLDKHMALVSKEMRPQVSAIVAIGCAVRIALYVGSLPNDSEHIKKLDTEMRELVSIPVIALLVNEDPNTRESIQVAAAAILEDLDAAQALAREAASQTSH
jgi:hypothetical protein